MIKEKAFNEIELDKAKLNIQNTSTIQNLAKY